MTRPRLLDLFCCGGGASVGYHRAGFDVVGVDLERRNAKTYPYDFHAADALEFVAEHGHEFDAIAASPPCQTYSITRHTHTAEHPDLVVPTREALIASGRPYVIENVVGAPLLHPLMLCGSEFGLTAEDEDGFPLRLERHRLFESNRFLYGAGGCSHDPRTEVAGVYGGATRKGTAAESRHWARNVRHGGYVPRKAIRAALLGIDWPMTEHQLNQSIPPAYTEFLGRQILEQL